MGEHVASTLNVNIDRLKKHSILIISLLAGASVSVAGAIPFVGLLVPHISRILAGPSHKTLLANSIVNGMSLTLIADIFARRLKAPEELEIGILTSLVGAPFFLWLLVRRNR